MADEFFGGGAAGGITLPGKQRAEAAGDIADLQQGHADLRETLYERFEGGLLLEGPLRCLLPPFG